MFDSLNREQIKRIVAYTGLNIFGLFIIYELHDFISPFLGAVIFFVLFKGLYHKLVIERSWKKSMASFAIILISFVIILIPVMSLSLLLITKISALLQDPSILTNSIGHIDQKIQSLTGMKLISAENILTFQTKIGQLIPSIIGQTLWIVASVVIMYIILFYMLINSERLTEEVNNFLPFNIENIQLFSRELEAITLSNAIGVPLISVAQGTAAGLGYWMFGMNDPFFWGAITALVAFIPFAGTAIVWLPASVLLELTGSTWQGFALIGYGILVVVNIDNISRIIIAKRYANVHPLVTLFGVIIGLNLFGLPGLIFGPLMLSYFVILAKLYRKVYSI